ncbi:TPA: hypothetical protein DEO28_01100 [Candidatus Dependentiae bacterium]|nr:MAG: hypothetical protein UR14_C0003G0070 [candidate division TM6 bacterium GW2011_GWE2_31_21]KKP53766.1 MAG: hypothetical protein UR43_C0003G0087 [candidate division TM6 bacterium GW2011_GWF2_33_332]HBS48480.1 hypothetical protein [Candidatus Dependentiae bacterium]HBZ73095.1 hypothetical protein [Candidatus Dependentiae bacterium]
MKKLSIVSYALLGACLLANNAKAVNPEEILAAEKELGTRHAPMDVLTHQKEFLSKVLAPKEVQQRLNSFTNDPEVKAFFVERPKKIASPFPHTDKSDPAYINYNALAQHIVQKYEIPVSGARLQNGQTIHFLGFSPNTYVFTIKNLPGYVLKMPKIYFSDNQEIIPNKHQAFSRVFNNEKLIKLVHDNSLQDFVYTFKIWLAPIGQFTTLNDDNYLVVEFKMPNLPSAEENRTLFKDMLSSQIPANFNTNRSFDEIVEDLAANYIKPEFIEHFAALTQVIREIGVWNLNLGNTSIINDSGKLKFVFFDLERAAGGYGSGENFYRPESDQRKKDQTASNAKAGLNELIKILKS